MTKVNQSQQKYQQAMQLGQQAKVRIASAKNPQELKKAQADLSKAQGNLTKAQGEYQAAVIQVLAQANAQANVNMLAAIRKYGLGVPAGYRIDKVKTLVEFQAFETVKVRTMILAEEFDEKGKPKKLTKEELATLKGADKTLPGYESSLEKLEVGQKVRVTLRAAPKKPVAKAKDDDKEVEEKDPKDKTEKKMQVKMLVIIAEAPAVTTTPKGKK